MKDKLIICVLFALLALTACNTQKQQIRKLDALSIQQPTEFARLSDLLNPCFKGIAKSDTTIIVGKADTVTTAGEIVITHVKDTVVKTITLPGRQITLPTFITIHDTIPDTRKAADLTAQLNDAKQAKTVSDTQLQIKTKQARTYGWWLVAIFSIIGIFVVYKIYMLINGGFAANIISKL